MPLLARQDFSFLYSVMQSNSKAKETTPQQPKEERCGFGAAIITIYHNGITISRTTIIARIYTHFLDHVPVWVVVNMVNTAKLK